MTFVSDRELTVTAISKHFDVSRQTIYTWRKEGMPVSGDLAVLESWVNEHKPDDSDDDTLASQYLKARIAKTQEEVAAKSLDNRVREGELVGRDAVGRWLASFVTEVRQQLESLPAAIVSELPGESRLAANDVASEQVRLLLTRLSQMPEELWADETVKDAE